VIRAEDRQAGRPEREASDPPGLARQPHHQGRHRRHGRHGLQLRAPAHALRPADPGRRPGAQTRPDTWKEDGFKRIDDLLAWTKANGMYLILDLHAAPGGQGNDLPIADRDPAKALAVAEPREPPQDRRAVAQAGRPLQGRAGDRGLRPDQRAQLGLRRPVWSRRGRRSRLQGREAGALWDFYKELTAAVREIDKRHMIILEGNCWGNNYKGMPQAWDDNMALSFHKYWNVNDEASIAGVLKLREETGLPLWLGESGENSNAWFRDAIALVEKHEIGWAFWPLKKIGFNQPLEITPTRLRPSWSRLRDQEPRPTADEAYAVLMTLASQDVRFENNIPSRRHRRHDPPAARRRRSGRSRKHRGRREGRDDRRRGNTTWASWARPMPTRTRPTTTSRPAASGPRGTTAAPIATTASTSPARPTRAPMSRISPRGSG
jgi:hypothetical protein